MGRRSPHRNLYGVAACVVFAIFSIVRESMDTGRIMEYLSDTRPSYSAIHLPSRAFENEFQSISFYGSSDRNATVLPRVVVLSAFEIPPSDIIREANHLTHDIKDDKQPQPQYFLSNPFQDLWNDDSRMEMPKMRPIDVNDHVYRSFEREWYEDCEPVTIPSINDSRDDKNTSIVRSTCNVFHELAIVKAYSSIRPTENDNNHATSRQGKSHIELLGAGSWRSVWKLFEGFVESSTDSHDFLQPDLVLKLLHTHRDFDEHSFSIHQVDAFVMEALSSSNYVVDSFGFCGQSVITEAATGGGKSLIKNRTLSSIDRLRIARDLARGLADLHALETYPWEETKKGYPNFPLVFAHHDVNPANLVSLGDGEIRWNDFNLGLVNRQYATSRTNGNKNNSQNITECPVPIRYEQLLWRSPEECDNQTGTLFLDDTNGRNTAAQAADVYSLGNVLFYVLARHQPWSHLQEGNSTKLLSGTSPNEKKESLVQIARAKIDGELPNLPERYRERPGAKILWEAVKMCYTHDPKHRPTARAIAEFLGIAHARLLKDSSSKKKAKAKEHRSGSSSNSTRTQIGDK
mmetsp:Transcript_3911/g.9316  ORF Transcript_3911/g.9316 Transcript_3911/m.9316 type:complete len:574 (-) Transcript_3911:95-1816(-)